MHSYLGPVLKGCCSTSWLFQVGHLLCEGLVLLLMSRNLFKVTAIRRACGARLKVGEDLLKPSKVCFTA